MYDLLQALGQFGNSLASVFVALAAVLLPWTPLAAWIAFWLYAVNWQKLRLILAKGGWVGVVLLGLVAVLVWGTVAPTPLKADVFGLKVSNFVEKTVYVSALICIMFFCGSLQLSGFCGDCAYLEEIPPADEHGGHGHGHNDHGHGHATELAHAAPAHGGHH